MNKNENKNDTNPKNSTPKKKKAVKNKKLTKKELEIEEQQRQKEFEEHLEFVFDLIHNEMHFAYGDISEDEHEWIEECFNNCMYLTGLLAYPEENMDELKQSYNDFKKAQMQMHIAMLFGDMMWVPKPGEQEKYVPEEYTEPPPPPEPPQEEVK